MGGGTSATGSRLARLIVVDDHPIVLEGLRRMFARCQDLQLIAALTDGASAVELARRQHPDLVVADLSMPGMDGIEVARQLKSSCPDVRVVILTGLLEPNVEQRALRAGATACLLKTLPKRRLVERVRVLSGVEPSFPEPKPTPRNANKPLSQREIDVIRLTCAGLTNLRIAQELGVALSTVQTYRKRLRVKLGLGSARALAAWAVRSGLDPTLLEQAAKCERGG